MILGTYVISPWVSMTYTSQSFTRNTSRDYISAKGMRTCTDLWKPDRSEVCGELLGGGVEFWSGIRVENLLLTAGAWECFVDDILVLGRHLGAIKLGTGTETGEKVEISVGERQVHVQCAVDLAVGVRHGKVARDILSWLRRVTGVRSSKTEVMWKI